MALIPLLGFQPDLDPTNQGILTDCANLLPTQRGFKGAPSPVATGLPAASAAVQAAVVAVRQDNTRRLFVATQTKLYEAGSSSYTDRSLGGGSYTGTTGGRWRFTQFGNITIATNKSDAMQESDTGAFSNVGTINAAPKAAIVEGVNDFVFAGNTTDGTFGDRPDGWWCCALGSMEDWLPNIATQAANGRLTDTPGPITGMRRLGDNIVIYKEKSIYLGTFVGPPVIWSFSLVSDIIGCSVHEAIVNVGSAHFFVGFDDIYMFDGTRPIPIGIGVKQFFFNDLAGAYRSLIIGAVDKAQSTVTWRYPSNAGGGVIDSALVYHWQAQKWGRDNRNVEAVVEYVASGITYDSLGSSYSTYDSLPTGISYDSPFWTANTPRSAIVDTTHTLQTLTGASASSMLKSGFIGDDTQYTTLQQVTPRFVDYPDSASMTHRFLANLGKTPTVGSTTNISSDGQFNLLKMARWHQIQLNLTGDHEISGINYAAAAGGKA